MFNSKLQLVFIYKLTFIYLRLSIYSVVKYLFPTIVENKTLLIIKRELDFLTIYCSFSIEQVKMNRFPFGLPISFFKDKKSFNEKPFFV
jgi:hypothetical protein